ncbi:MAG: class II aldolase/adducin family protein [Dehalococcoidia bacterium]|nr:class II aldolase/adducin family protein [Dehalococcoidia bacterium]
MAWDPALTPLVEMLIEVGRDLRSAGLVTSHGGNLSTRWGQGACITGTGTMLGRLTSEQFAVVDSRGRAQGMHDPPPSSDTAIHLAVYEHVPEARVVVHAHPVHAIALSFDWDAILPINLEGQLFIPRVPVVEAAWQASAGPVAEALREVPVVMVRGHGAYARGSDGWEALKWISALDEAAQILILAGKG